LKVDIVDSLTPPSVLAIDRRTEQSDEGYSVGTGGNVDDVDTDGFDHDSCDGNLAFIGIGG
jgi:hypothetical protein